MYLNQTGKESNIVRLTLTLNDNKACGTTIIVRVKYKWKSSTCSTVKLNIFEATLFLIFLVKWVHCRCATSV